MAKGKKRSPPNPSRTTTVEYVMLALLALLVLFVGLTLCRSVGA